MMHASLLRAALVGCVALVSVLSPVSASAQANAANPIFLTIPESYPDLGARVIVMREPGREIVMLDPAAATVDELGAGLRMLAKFRRERPEPTNGEMIPIMGFAPAPNISADERARLEAALAELQRRPIANVGNLGRGRWMRLSMR
ncbi:MAG: hypothetical protein FJ207_11975 [Gemmatimonadetes bacterium]|nr:hypothetical protein [Gemmatimonadota bacterium]